jgi:tetratricopeptide (TPR) repeat protein
MAIYEKDYERAKLLGEECLTLLQEQEDEASRYATAELLDNLGIIALYQGHYARAGSHFEESLAMMRETKQWKGVSYALNNLGLATLYQGNAAKATSFFAESLTLKQRIDDKHGIAWTLEGLAGVAEVQQQPDRAARLYGAAQALRDAVELSLPLEDCPGFERSIRATRDQLGEIAYTAAWEEGYAMPTEQVIAYALAPDG